VVLVAAGTVREVREGEVVLDLDAQSVVHGKKPPLGSGERFRALVSSIKARGGVRDPAAVAASIGRRKYGTERFQELAARSRRRG
jgi:hypothetical protein